MSTNENINNDAPTEEDRPTVFETPENCCTPEDCCGQGEENCANNADKSGCCGGERHHHGHHGHHRGHGRRDGHGRRHRDAGEQEYGNKGRRNRSERRAERDKAAALALAEQGTGCECGRGRGAHLVGFLVFGAGVFAIGYVVGNKHAQERLMQIAATTRAEAIERYPAVREHLHELADKLPRH